MKVEPFNDNNLRALLGLQRLLSSMEYESFAPVLLVQILTSLNWNLTFSASSTSQFVDMNGWRLESPDQEDVVSVLNTASDTVVADIQELSPTVQTLHWVAPASYLGNRVRNGREREITQNLNA